MGTDFVLGIVVGIAFALLCIFIIFWMNSDGKRE